MVQRILCLENMDRVHELPCARIVQTLFAFPIMHGKRTIVFQEAGVLLH